MIYYIGQYNWAFSDDLGKECWRIPESAIGGIDISPVTEQVEGGNHIGIFWGDTLPAGYTQLGEGNCKELDTTSDMQDAIENAIGVRPEGATLVDLIWDLFTAKSDPDGLTAPRPLMPNHDCVMSLDFEGHSRVKTDKFKWGDKHTDKVKKILEQEYEEAKKDKDKDHVRRVVDYRVKQFKVDWKEIVPKKDHTTFKGTLPHKTTITDAFTRSDQSDLGTSSEGWSWVNQSGYFSIHTNRARRTNSGNTYRGARANTNLSSSNTYAQVKIGTSTSSSTTVHVGSCVRFDTSLQTFYVGLTTMTQIHRLYKAVNEAYTELWVGGDAGSVGDTIKTAVNGSVVYTECAGTVRAAVTDTAISTGVQTGIYLFSSSYSTYDAYGDDFEAGDLPTGQLSGWSYRKKITIDNTNVSANLSNYPLLVKLSGDTDVGGHMTDTTNYYDLCFTDSSGIALLPYERDEFSISGGSATAVLRVSVPTITTASTTDIYMYYGKSGASNMSHKEAVWPNYTAVYHLPNGSTLSANDSTDTYNGTVNGATAVAGKIGGACSTDGSNDSVAMNNLVIPTTRGSISFWWQPRVSLSTGRAPLVCIRESGKNFDVFQYDGKLYSGWSQTGNDHRVQGDITGLSIGTWYFIQLTWINGSTTELFINRSSYGTTSSLDATWTTSGVYIGYDGLGSYYGECYVDGVKWHKSVPATAWLDFEYYNESEADNEISFGSEEDLTGAAPALGARGLLLTGVGL